jgi:hypothetical protein
MESCNSGTILAKKVSIWALNVMKLATFIHSVRTFEKH